MDEKLKSDIDALCEILQRHAVNDATAAAVGDEMDRNRKRVVGLLPGTERVVELQKEQFKLAAFNNAIVTFNTWRRERQDRMSKPKLLQ